ncbi:DUF2524 family protein [Virgibacillus sp. MSP4-1]|uniref:DUF2524 family protein n=1 Tax=Salinibacillus aidingensis TaxID=237684 RepID=A0ABN1BLC6_9BACI|nr:DUF2524 family protein [Virgibacillus sp. MSP4-1]QHS23084.1 DUF2524 family protein [Virgibacillus sp. MSP4-1]
MATRDSMEQLITEIKDKIDTAKKELDETNRNGYDVDSEYTNAQTNLEQAEAEIEHMKLSANHQQREQLHRLHLQVSQVLNDMYLDQVDLNEYS